MNIKNNNNRKNNFQPSTIPTAKAGFRGDFKKSASAAHHAKNSVTVLNQKGIAVDTLSQSFFVGEGGEFILGNYGGCFFDN